MSQELIRKILFTLQVLLGVSSTIAAIWSYVLPFDPDEIISLIDFIIAILLPAVAGVTLAVSGGRRLYAEYK